MKKTIKETTSDIQSRIARLQRELDSEEDSLEYADGGAHSQSKDRIADLKSQIAKLKKELGGENVPVNEMTDDEYVRHRLKHMPKKPKGQDAFDSFKGRKPREEDLSGAKFKEGDAITFDGCPGKVYHVKKTPDGYEYHIGYKRDGHGASIWSWVNEDEISPIGSAQNESSEQVCDWCGIPLKDGESVKHGKYTLCQPCASGMCEESAEKEESWLGLKGVYLFTDEKTGEQFVMYHGKTLPLEDVAAEGGFDLPYDKFEFGEIMELAERGDNKYRKELQDWVEQAAVFAGFGKVDEGSQEDALAMPNRIQEIEVQLQNNTQRLYNMLADEYLDNDKMFDELLEERDALVEELCGCKGLVKEETREERAYLRSIGEYDGYLGKKKPARRAPSKSKSKFMYAVTASGFGTKNYYFPSKKECLDEMKKDAEQTALEYDAEVQWWDEKECAVVDRQGQEIATFEYLGAMRGFNEETYEDKVHRDWLDAVQKHKSERQAIKDRIRDIVGDDNADEVFEYWDRIQSSFNMRFKHGDFDGSVEKHLQRLAKILGPEGKDIIDDINAKFTGQAKELSDYYATHDYTGD